MFRNASQTKVWYYLTVDSMVANRAYFAQPRATLQLVNSLATGNQLISLSLWGADAAAIPAGIQTLIDNSTFTAAFTDILPADAKFAQHRANCGTATTATLGCLGYGTADANVGMNIQSAFSGATVQPVNFNIFGNDPISGNAIPAFSTISIGAVPLIFIANRTNSAGLGAGVGNPVLGGMAYQGSPVLLFSGLNCDTSAFGVTTPLAAVNPILRDPLSATMNIFEYNIMLPGWTQDTHPQFWFSQEGYFYPPYSIPLTFSWGAIGLTGFPGTSNPLNGGCPANGVNNDWAGGAQGKRLRAIGDSEEITAVKNTVDSMGYLLFSYENVAPIAASSSYGYLWYGEWPGGTNGALIPTDPINPSGMYGQAYRSPSGALVFTGNGQLPTCNAPCPLPPNTSFPNVRSGAYLEWSLLRATADSGTVGFSYLQSLAVTMANQVNVNVPDFVPYNPTSDGDSGLQFYRSHFAPVGVSFNATNTPNNGIDVNGAYVQDTEAGSDVGGCVDWRYTPNGPTNLLNCRY